MRGRSYLAMALVLTRVAAHASADLLQGGASGRYGSGNVTYGEAENWGVDLPDDGTNSPQSTGVQVTQNANLIVGAEAMSNLAVGALGSTAGWMGASVLDHGPQAGTIWFLGANGYTMYLDSIAITSPTHPAGFPVQIQFSLHVDAALLAAHSENPGGNNNNAFAYALVEARVSGPGGTQFIDNDDNRAIIDTDTPGNNMAIGLLNPATPHLDFTYDASVGDTLTFYANTDARVQGNLAPNTSIPANTAGQALVSVGMAFGATSLTDPANINLESQIMNGALFPGASQATAANAQGSTPPSPIPEPATAVIMALMGVGALRRRRAA